MTWQNVLLGSEKNQKTATASNRGEEGAEGAAECATPSPGRQHGLLNANVSGTVC